MSKCTAKQAVAAMQYWVGYYEKASSNYANTREKSAFTKNKGSANYTYAGKLCGVQGQAWCAAQVSTAIYEACGSKSADAKSVMWGVWPYVNCAQVWDAATNNKKYWSHYQRWTCGKGARKTYYPQAGDIIVFTDNGYSRSHTGMVYAVDSKYVYTIEGNSGNMCRKRSYLLTSSYIYGWIRPNYAEEKADDPETESAENYGAVCSTLPKLHVLDKGCAGGEVFSMQTLLIAYGFSCGTKGADGAFGPDTKDAVLAFQKSVGINQDGICGSKTWAALLDKPDRQ